MTRQQEGPRRAKSVQSYLRQTRVLAAVAVAALAVGIASDFTVARFWTRHPLIAGLAASVIVVMLSAAVVNEVIERRQRQRWSVLAQYIMFELVRNARMIWTGILDVSGLLPSAANHQESVELGAPIVRDTTRLTAAVRATINDDESRARLQAEIALLAESADEVMSRWAGVMLNNEAYAEILDRHVELAGAVAWIGSLLDGAHAPDDARRFRRARSNPATQIQGDRGGEWLADRIVVVAQMAEELDRGTFGLALRVVPVEWWATRLATTPSPASD